MRNHQKLLSLEVADEIRIIRPRAFHFHFPFRRRAIRLQPGSMGASYYRLLLPMLLAATSRKIYGRGQGSRDINVSPYKPVVRRTSARCHLSVVPALYFLLLFYSLPPKIYFHRLAVLSKGVRGHFHPLRKPIRRLVLGTGIRRKCRFVAVLRYRDVVPQFRRLGGQRNSAD